MVIDTWILRRGYNMLIIGGTTATVSGYASEKKLKIIRWI